MTTGRSPVVHRNQPAFVRQPILRKLAFVGVHRALSEKWFILDPFSPIAKVTPVTTVFLDTGLPQILTLSKNSDNELKQNYFTLKMPECCQCFIQVCCFCPVGSAAFALWAYASVVVGGVQGGHRKANLLLGAVQKRPLWRMPLLGAWHPPPPPSYTSFSHWQKSKFMDFSWCPPNRWVADPTPVWVWLGTREYLLPRTEPR